MNADAHPDSNAAKMHSFDVVSIQNVFPSFDDDDDDDVDDDDDDDDTMDLKQISPPTDIPSGHDLGRGVRFGA